MNTWWTPAYHLMNTCVSWQSGLSQIVSWTLIPVLPLLFKLPSTTGPASCSATNTRWFLRKPLWWFWKQLLEGYNLYPTQKKQQGLFLKKQQVPLYQSHEGKGEINPTESQGQWDLELVFRYFLISRRRFLSDWKWSLPCISSWYTTRPCT